MDSISSFLLYLHSQCPFLPSSSTPSPKTPIQTPIAPIFAQNDRKPQRRSLEHDSNKNAPRTTPKKSHKSPKKQFMQQNAIKSRPKARKSLTLGEFIARPALESPQLKSTPNSSFSSNNSSFSLDSKDEFPSLGSIEVPKSPRKPLNIKRITPTPVNKGQFSPTKRLNFESAPISEAPESCLSKERQIIRIKRLDSAESPKPNLTPPVLCTPAKQNISFASEEPDTAKVTRKDEIVDLVGNLVEFIENGCEVELFGQIHLILNLLSVKDTGADRDLLLGNVHNCVYFAATAIRELKWVFLELPSEILKLLVQNERLRRFEPDLVVVFEEKFAERDQNGVDFNVGFEFGLPHNLDVKKEAFPDQNAFHAFKKQRDSFYQIHREWKKQQSEVAEVDFGAAFGERVSRTVRLSSHTINHVLLSQLIVKLLVEDHKIGAHDSNRLKRLEERLTGVSNSVADYGAKPTFHGVESFVKDFILHSDCNLFTSVFRDALWTALMHLQSVEIEQNWNKIQILQFCDQLMRQCSILAKFIGYLTFLPYQQQRHLPQNCLTAIQTVRNDLDALPSYLLKVLQNATDWPKMSINICWIVELLSLADPTTVDLHQYRQVYAKLKAIFKSTLTQWSSSNSLVAFKIDWLFSLPQFAKLSLDSASAENFQIETDQNFCSNLLLLRQCPWMKQLNALLTGGSSSQCQTPAVRKIKPLLLHSGTSQSERKEDRLLIELETNFFAGQSSQVKKCVQLVAECVANQLSTQLKAHWLREAQSIQEQNDNLPSDLIESSLKNIEQSTHQAFELSKNGLNALLSGQCSESVLTVAVELCKRNAIKRCKLWMRNSSTKDLLNREIRKISPSSGAIEKFSENAEFASVLQNFRETLQDYFEGCADLGRLNESLSECQRYKTHLKSFPPFVSTVFKGIEDKLQAAVNELAIKSA